jgi:glycine oxidase
LSGSPYNAPRSDLSCDLLVAGGGVVGLWVARLAMLKGLDTILLEKRSAGSGASGGLLGALIPHLPERFDPKKLYQFEALRALPDRVAELEAETGIACGFRRCGRLMPLYKEAFSDIARGQVQAAEENWHGAETGFSWRVLDEPPFFDWPTGAVCPLGVVHDTLTARIAPRGYLSALAESLHGKIRLVEGDGLARIERGNIVTDAGVSISAGKTILAAGHETFGTVAGLIGVAPRSLGIPVKGQAALLQADLPDDLPLVFHDGTYVVVHGSGRVAVGSTSEPEFGQPFETDGKLDDIIEKATVLCPALKGAPVIERWAGLRPRAVRRDPMIGVVPGQPDLVVATGGFKITFGIAHRMAADALELALTGECANLPATFRLDHHLAARS